MIKIKYEECSIMKKNMRRKVKQAGVVLMVGALALQGTAVVTAQHGGVYSPFEVFDNELDHPIVFSNFQPAGVNTTIFGWSVGTHRGHERVVTAAEGNGWRIEVHAHEDRPWQVVAIGDVPENTVFWLYAQGESRNSVGGNTSTWTSREVFRLQVIVNSAGEANIPTPEGINGRYQLKLGDPRFEDQRQPTFPPVPLPDDVDLGDWELEEESDETFYDVDPEGMMPTFPEGESEDTFYDVDPEGMMPTFPEAESEDTFYDVDPEGMMPTFPEAESEDTFYDVDPEAEMPVFDPEVDPEFDGEYVEIVSLPGERDEEVDTDTDADTDTDENTNTEENQNARNNTNTSNNTSNRKTLPQTGYSGNLSALLGTMFLAIGGVALKVKRKMTV
jgi:LPXTG-motif cell wall-anchored protein